MNDRTFIVCEVTREDLEQQGYASDLSDEVMRRVASLMRKVITSCNYWDALDYACEECGIEKVVEE